jgi:hypothetical protein|tara:strand:+ start:927 stop:2756 length:1830 start_codon:yes stop_codon:yes gene_type:complete
MAKDNRTYYNPRGNRFTGMFDSGEAFVPVDWSKITGDIVDRLQAVDKARQDKRNEIQTKTDELLTDLRDYQAGGNNTFNAYVLDGSTQVKDYMLMQNKLLKQGKLDPNAYTRSSQLLQDDWNSFQEAAKTFNADYAEAIKAAEAGDVSKLGLLSFDELQAATDIQNSRLVINTDGRLYSQTGDGKLVGFTNMNARQKDIPKNYDIMDGSKQFASTLGKYKKAYPSMTIEDITRQPDFQKARDTYIDGVLNQGTGRDFLSILTQNGYELTQDPSKVDDNTILVKADSNGMLQPDKQSLEKHRGRAKEILEEAISVQLDYIESPGGTISAAERLYNIKQSDALKGGGDVYALVAGLSSSDANAVETSATQLMQQFSGIDRIKNIVDPSGKNTGMEIYTSGKAQPVPVMFTDPNGNAKTREQITAELFPLFYGDKLTTQQFSEIVSGYTGGLEEGSRNMFQTAGYSTPFIDDDTDTYNLDRSRPREIARTNLANNKDLLTSAGKHTTAITKVLEGTAGDEEKQIEIRKLNQQYMQQLEPLLRYTDKENKTQSLDLEMDSGGNIIVVDGGKTYTIVDTVTGNVNINQLQDLINQKQAPAGTRTGGGKGRMSDF